MFMMEKSYHSLTMLTATAYTQDVDNININTELEFIINFQISKYYQNIICSVFSYNMTQ